MGDELISGTGLLTALGVKLAYDVCGPTAQYLGGQLATYSQIGVENVRRVFSRASERLGEKPEGAVPPRVLKEVLAEGYFCEDEVIASYLGGVLASSKGPLSRDDRGVAFCSLISSLSAYQIRTHCIIYSAILQVTPESIEHRSAVREVFRWLHLHGITVCIEESNYISAMEFSDRESPDLIGEHSFVGLEKRGLSEGGWRVVHQLHPNDEKRNFRYFYPTTLGIELYLWGLGVGDRGMACFKPEILPEISIPFSIAPLKVHFGRVGFG